MALLLLSLLALAQEPIVARVRVEAPPAELPRLLHYVEIRPGEPLRREAVRHAVELLYATGEFEDVIVDSEPEGQGVSVTFRPIPVPRLGRIVVEGEQVVSANRVRRLARLRPGERLWSGRLDQATRSVEAELRRQGWLEAKVSASLRPARALADAVFAIRAGTRVRVEQATLEGLSAAEATAVASLVAPRPGQPYERERAQQAAEAIRRKLVAASRWRASVEVEEVYQAERARVHLRFRADAGPYVSIVFRGVQPGAALRRRIEALLREAGLRSDALDDAADRIEDEFRRRGHRSVQVARSEDPRPGGLSIVYTTAPGPAAVVASVRVEGAPSDLEPLLATRAGAALVDATLDADAQTLVRALEERGHLAPRVEADVPDGGGLVPVVFRVRPGPRTLVAAVEVEAPGLASPPTKGAGELRVRRGQPYRVRDLTRDRSDLLQACRDDGYLEAEVEPSVAFSADRSEASIRYRVNAGEQTRIERLVVAGLLHTHEEVVRRELKVAEGEPLGTKRLLESQTRLSALGIFERASLVELDPESPGRRSLVVAVEEGPRSTIATGIGYAERDLLRVSAEVTRRNLGGLDRSLSAFVRASFRGNRALATYREPYLFGRRLEMLVTAFREEEDRDAFDFTRSGALVQTSRPLGPQFNLILRYTLQETDTFNLTIPIEEVDRQFQSSTFSGPSVSLINDTRDDPIDPRRGRFLTADLALSHRALGGDSFVKGFVQASGYDRLNARTVLAVGGRLGLARTFGAGSPLRLPVPDRFYGGGDYGPRGFPVDGVGPQQRAADGTLLPSGGNALVFGGAELRLSLRGHLSLAAFGEAGNAYVLASDLSLSDLRYSAGLGLRYLSALGPVRVDWGYKLNRRAGEPAYRVHFTIGHAF